jgi:hypothetical protein
MGWCLEWQKKESKSSKKMRVDEVDEFLIMNLAKDEEYLHKDSLLLKENYTCTCFFLIGLFPVTDDWRPILSYSRY